MNYCFSLRANYIVVHGQASTSAAAAPRVFGKYPSKGRNSLRVWENELKAATLKQMYISTHFSKASAVRWTEKNSWCFLWKQRFLIHCCVNDKKRNLCLSDHRQRCEWFAWPLWFTITLTNFNDCEFDSIMYHVSKFILTINFIIQFQFLNRFSFRPLTV